MNPATKQLPHAGVPAKKHVILFLATNPRDTGRLALDREARAIHVELKRSGYRTRPIELGSTASGGWIRRMAEARQIGFR